MSEIDHLARVDVAERVGVLIERMAALHGDAPIADEYLAGAQLVELFRDGPEPPTPAAPANVVPFRPPRPFDRAAHCQAIAAGGGARTVALYGAQHMRAIGKAGRAAYVARYGRASWVALMQKKGWTPRTPDLAADLAEGRYLADLAA